MIQRCLLDVLIIQAGLRFGEIFSVLGSGCAKLRNVASSVIAEVGVIVHTVLCLKARVFFNLNIIFSIRRARFALYTAYM